jgi:hypothetical protein
MKEIKPGSWEHLIVGCLQRIERAEDAIQDKTDQFGELKPRDEFLRERLARLDSYLRIGIEKIDARKLDLPEDHRRTFERWLSHQPKEFVDKIYG